MLDNVSYCNLSTCQCRDHVTTPIPGSSFIPQLLPSSSGYLLWRL